MSSCSAASPVENPKNGVELSLIVATRNRCRQLGRCLQSMRRINAKRIWELVLVDNGSSDETPEVIEDFIASAPVPVVYLREPRPGKSNALNTALGVARGQILAFTDDDCYPATDFIDRVSDAFEEPSVGYITGRIMLHDAADYPMTINESMVPLSFPARTFITGGSVVGANLAFRRAVLVGIGGFDPLLGPGGVMAGAEDTDVAFRASARGWQGRYCPEVVVSHHHGRKAADLPPLMKEYGIGFGAYLMKLFITGYGFRRSGRIFWHVCGQLTRTPRTVLWQPVGAIRYARWYLMQRRPRGGSGTRRADANRNLANVPRSARRRTTEGDL